MFTPRQYQLDLKAGIYRSWQDGNRNTIAVSPTGSGKTKLMGMIARELTRPGVAIAHRKELVGQISGAMAELGVRHNIIAPEGTVRNCIARHIELTGKSHYDRRAKFTVSAVDTLIGRTDSLIQWASEVGFWFVDECFPAGTLVDGKPIETIRKGDLVQAFDTATGAFELRAVHRVFKRIAPPSLTKIVKADGGVVIATLNHPFWVVGWGWKAAWQLDTDDILLGVSGQIEIRSITTMASGGCEVYNLEVDTRHTYVAGGVVVHNCHHVLAGNKWGKATALFPNAYGLGVTATPLRADRKSLHVDQGGVFSDMVLGPTMRDLINEGALCDYRIFAPPASIDRASLDVGATGDFTGPSMRAAAHKSKIVGDIVGHYRKLVSGKRAICFVVDVEQAVEMAQAFRDAGYRAEAVSANTPEAIREQIIAKFATGKLDILCNVDLFGEGFDVPAVEVVIMGRPTESYGLYVQQFGRALRVLAGKLHGIIIDHVGNVKRHGLPDAPRTWTLFNDERGKRTQRDPDAIPVTACPSCFMAYEAFHPKCPFCGHKPEPAGRSLPEQVDGDLVELDPKVLAEMRGEADRIMVPLTGTVNDPRSIVIARNWAARTEAQRELRDAIATWAGPWHQRGVSDSEIMRRFFFKFGTDVMTAQTLGTAEANELKDRINADI